MMSRRVNLNDKVIEIMTTKRFREPIDPDYEDYLKSIEPISSPESEETEEEEIVTRFKNIKASNPVYGLIPPHCSSFLPPRIDPATHKRDPIPTRVVETDECFDSCPKIISREEWGARTTFRQPAQLTHRVRPAIFKETESHNCTETKYCLKGVKYLQTLHLLYREWDDIAFSFIIGETGDIFEGRGWGVENEKKQKFCGIAYLGRYVARDPFEEPTEPMLRSTYNLIMCGVKKGFLKNPFESGKYRGSTPEEIIREFIKNDEKVSYMLKLEEVPQVWSHANPNMRVLRAINYSSLIGVIVAIGVVIHSLIDTYEKFTT